MKRWQNCVRNHRCRKKGRGRKVLKKIIPALVVLALAASLVQAEVTQNVKVPVTMYVEIPCPESQILSLTGDLHMLYALTMDENGGVHVKSHVQPQNLKGEIVWPDDAPNLGAKYNGTGVTQYERNIKKGETYTYINNFRMIGQGKAPNLTVHVTLHTTVNANGDITTDVVNVKSDCKEKKPAPSKGETVATKWGKIKSQY
jgi:hypothetical protein